MASIVGISNRALQLLGHDSITSLAALQESPAFGYGSQYRLPSDSLRVLQVLNIEGLNLKDYTIEGRNVLLNDDGGIFVKYVSDEADPAQYDSLLNEALAAYMAATICEKLTQSNTKRELAERQYNGVLTMAKRVDGQENPPVEFEESTWLLTRNY
jgi:hypothetical protein